MRTRPMGTRRLTCGFRFDLLAELGTHAVVVGADVMQTPGGQLVGVVELQGSDQKGVRLYFLKWGHREIVSHRRGDRDKGSA